ncbi:MAG: bifunctional 4-hydroxy-2-oxoglutarate aldolase/2-dehydro-3-deoxy-phosphogluconate aldolase [Streptosporangiaceae bacterium]
MTGGSPGQDVAGLLARVRLIPVITIHDAAQAEPLAEALKAGGLPCAEVTLRTDAAEEAIRIMSQDPDMLVGAGTVLSENQAERAVAAGSGFIVTPGFSGKVVRACQDRSVPVIPGAVTATEIGTALDAGLRVVKFFPAATMGGLAALRALAGPFPMMRFVPTGGVTAGNMSEYLGLSCVLAVGGSWVVAADLLASGNYAEVTRRASEAVSLAGKV